MPNRLASKGRRRLRSTRLGAKGEAMSRDEALSRAADEAAEMAHATSWGVLEHSPSRRHLSQCPWTEGTHMFRSDARFFRGSGLGLSVALVLAACGTGNTES